MHVENLKLDLYIFSIITGSVFLT